MQTVSHVTGRSAIVGDSIQSRAVPRILSSFRRGRSDRLPIGFARLRTIARTTARKPPRMPPAPDPQPPDATGYANVPAISTYIVPQKQAAKRHYGSHQYFTKR